MVSVSKSYVALASSQDFQNTGPLILKSGSLIFENIQDYLLVHLWYQFEIPMSPCSRVTATCSPARPGDDSSPLAVKIPFLTGSTVRSQNTQQHNELAF